MDLHIKGPLPEQSANKLVQAMNDSHVCGLINHCVEVLVWKNRILFFVTGFGVAAVLFRALH